MAFFACFAGTLLPVFAVFHGTTRPTIPVGFALYRTSATIDQPRRPGGFLRPNLSTAGALKAPSGVFFKILSEKIGPAAAVIEDESVFIDIRLEKRQISCCEGHKKQKPSG